MKVRANIYDENLIYLRAETTMEKWILDNMWRNGVKVFCGGAELGIHSNGYESSQFIEKGDKDVS